MFWTCKENSHYDGILVNGLFLGPKSIFSLGFSDLHLMSGIEKWVCFAQNGINGGYWGPTMQKYKKFLII